jgi:hypothetical protein
MEEVLYCPINNEMLLFSGAYKFEVDTMIMTLYVYSNRKKMKKVSAKNLIHIGWL